MTTPNHQDAVQCDKPEHSANAGAPRWENTTNVETRLRSTPGWVRLSSTIIRGLPYARYRLMNAIARWNSSPFLCELRVSDHRLRFVCDLRESHSREVCFMGYFEPQETVVVRHLLGPGKTFVDLGANWGYFSLLAADRVGAAGKVVACEPHPTLLELLQANIRLNGLKSVDVYGEAVADREGELNLTGFDPSSTNWGVSSLLGSGSANNLPSYRVPANRLDTILCRSGVDSVDLLKVDIEGAESLILPGMDQDFRRQRFKAVLLELHPGMIAGGEGAAKALLEPIFAAGYRAWRIDHSPAAFRRAAYRLPSTPAEFLTPFDSTLPLGSWSHLVLLAPDIIPTW